VDETLQKAGYPVLETLDGVDSRAAGVPICRLRGKIEPAPIIPPASSPRGASAIGLRGKATKNPPSATDGG